MIQNGRQGFNRDFSILQYLGSYGRWNHDFGVYTHILDTKEPVDISYEAKIGFVIGFGMIFFLIWQKKPHKNMHFLMFFHCQLFV